MAGGGFVNQEFVQNLTETAVFCGLQELSRYLRGKNKTLQPQRNLLFRRQMIK